MFKYLNIKNSEKGFTLLEALVATLIFSIIAVIITGILSQSLKIQKRASLALRIQENAMTILEAMAREIRVSDITNQNSSCTATSLTMVHPTEGTITYSLNNGALRRTVGSLVNDISSSDIEFSTLLFCIKGSSLGDNIQTRVTIISSLKNKSSTSNQIDIQTTVTSRVITN